HRPLQSFALAGKIRDAVWRIGDYLRGLRAAEALEIDGLLEQRVEGSRDEEIEVGDLRELAQRKRRLESRVAQDASHARVGFLAPATRGEEPADDVVQRIRLRELARVDVQLGGKLLGEPVIEQPRARLCLDLQQLRTDERKYSPVL